MDTENTDNQKPTTTWYYYDGNGQKQGPVTGGQLKGLAKKGMISPGTMVESESGKVVLATKVGGLKFAVAEEVSQTAIKTWIKRLSSLGIIGLTAICLGVIDCAFVAIEWEEILNNEKRIARNLQVSTQNSWSGETVFTAVLKGQLKQRLQFDVFVILVGSFVVAYDLRRHEQRRCQLDNGCGSLAIP